MATHPPNRYDDAQRDAADVFAAVFDLPQCPVCRMINTLSRHGLVQLCELCTVAELGLSIRDNAERIFARKSVKVWLERDPDEPPPSLSWKQWRARVRGR